MSTNLMRVSGLASGMDTESIVKQLVQTRRTKADAYTKTKTKSEWRQEAYLNVNKNMANFILDSRKNLGLTDYTYFGQLKSGSIDKVDWAKKATSSSEEFFTARATASATGEYNIQVKQLAQGASITGRAVSGVKTSDTVGVDKALSLNINGEVKTIDLKADDTISSAIRKIKDETGINVSFGKVGQDSSGNDTSMLFLSTKTTGAFQIIQSSDQTTLDFFKSLGVDESALLTGSKGQNSVVSVNGSEVENQSNNININGIEITLKKVSDTAQKVSVETDADAIVNKVKEFIESYNKVIGELQDQLKEKVYRDYQPLTKEQKEALSDEEVKLWEEKAKSGLLASNQTIKNMISEVRSGLYDKVTGMGSMYELGITTGKYTEGAKLELNEDKLRDAIAKDPQKVLDTLFKAPSDQSNYKINSSDSETVRAQKKAAASAQRADTGVFVRIMGDIANGMENIAKQAGSGQDSNLLKSVKSNILADVVAGNTQIDKDILQINKRIDEENRKLSNYETSLWKRFSAMEKAIRQMQDQSGWLSQFGS